MDYSLSISVKIFLNFCYAALQPIMREVKTFSFLHVPPPHGYVSIVKIPGEAPMGVSRRGKAR